MLKKLRNRPLITKIPDEIRFLRQWFDNPLKTGAVAPSSPALARRMASFIDPAKPGLVVELGPGTGVVTQEVLARGVEPSRVLAVEYSTDFVNILRDRFAGTTVMQGDAYDFQGNPADSYPTNLWRRWFPACRFSPSPRQCADG